MSESYGAKRVPNQRSDSHGIAHLHRRAGVSRRFSALIAFPPTCRFRSIRIRASASSAPDHLFWDAFARYDAGWYHGIASQGYIYGAGGRNNLAFFPVYPLLMRAGGWLLGGRQQDFYFAGIVSRGWRLPARWRCSIVWRFSICRARPRCAPSCMPRHLPVRLLLRHGLFGEPVPAGARDHGVRAPTPALARRGGRRRDHDGHARHRRDGRSRAGAGCLAGGRPRSALRWASALAAVAGCLAGIRRLLRVQLHAQRHDPFALVRRRSRSGATSRAATRLAASPGSLQALLSRPYQFLTTERMAPYDTLNALRRARRARRSCRSSGGASTAATR